MLIHHRGARLVAFLALSLLLASCQAARRGPRPDDAASIRHKLAQRVPRLAEDPAPAIVAHQVNDLLSAPLGEATALRLALALNPDVREGYARLGVARHELMQAGLLSNPTLHANAKLFSAGPEIEFGLTKPLLDLLFVRHRTSIAAAERQVVEADVTANLVELLFAIRRRMIQIQAARAVVALQESGVDAADTTSDLFAKLQEAGNILDQARTSGAIAASRAQLTLSAAKATEAEHRESLRRLLGLPATAPPIVLAEELPTGLPKPPDAGVVGRDAQRSSLDHAMMRAAALAAQRGRTLAGMRKQTWLREGGAVGKREGESGAWGFGPEIGIEIPIFDTGSAEFGRASAAYRRACAMAEATRLDVLSAARRFSARAGVAHERERHMREEYLPLRKRFVADLVGRYNDMQIGAFAVLEAKIMELGAQREYVETLRDAWLAYADINELRAGHLNRDRLEATDLPEESDHPTLTGGGH